MTRKRIAGRCDGHQANKQVDKVLTNKYKVELTLSSLLYIITFIFSYTYKMLFLERESFDHHNRFVLGYLHIWELANSSRLNYNYIQ